MIDKMNACQGCAEIPINGVCDGEAALATALNETLEEAATETAGVACEVMFSGSTAPADYARAYSEAIRALKTPTPDTKGEV
jgi:hypothetical protein